MYLGEHITKYLSLEAKGNKFLLIESDQNISVCTGTAFKSQEKQKPEYRVAPVLLNHKYSKNRTIEYFISVHQHLIPSIHRQVLEDY